MSRAAPRPRDGLQHGAGLLLNRPVPEQSDEYRDEKEYEADDIVGSLMTLCRQQGLPATLVTRDKDFAQLIRAGDIYWDYTDNAKYLYHQIEERFGVAPERFADFLALMGDSVDNIKGVPGVGPKTAAALMK